MGGAPWMLQFYILHIALPAASLAVLVAGLLYRRDRPAWLLWCAVAVSAAALAILLATFSEDGGDSLTLAMIVWFILCLLVLGLALGRRWRGERSRSLELAGLVMPFVVLTILAAVLVWMALTPPTPVEEHPDVRHDSPVASANAANVRLERCHESTPLATIL